MLTSIGYKRIESLLFKLQDTIVEAEKTDSLETSFYKSDARKTLFFLEALCRIYRKIYDKEFFTLYRNEFKSLEDQLGKIDYFESYLIYFSSLNNFPKQLLDSLKNHYETELCKLKSLLIANKWTKTTDIDGKLPIILLKLKTINWLSPNDEKNNIAKVMRKEVKKIEKKYLEGNYDNEDLELGIHEFRRKVRWISIYAQALGGLVQLKDDQFENELSQYMTPEVLKSPFNQMPKNKYKSETILLSKSCFYALSYVIDKLGDMKDDGLKSICLQQIMTETNYKNESVNELMKNSIHPAIINSDAKLILDQFIIDNKVLNKISKDLKEAYSQ